MKINNRAKEIGLVLNKLKKYEQLQTTANATA